MSEGWQLRPAGVDDLPAIVELIRAEDLRYRGRAEINLPEVQTRIASDLGFDVERDMVIAEAAGEAVAAVVINPRAAMITVHPDRDDEQLRTELLAWSERRQAELLRQPFRVAAPAANGPEVAMLTGAGYEIERFYASMIRDFVVTGPPEPVTVPSGYRMRQIDREGDVLALHAVDDRAFRERDDYLAETVEEYAGRHLDESTFAPGWSLIAETQAGGVAGSVVGVYRPGADIGYVAIVAVDPDHRRRGLARNLLLAAFGAIHAAGLTRAELHVASDNPTALDLYTGVGMHETERFDHYVRSA